MSIVLDGTTGITTPGLTNTGTETLVNLTTTGNTILGDASTDTLNVGNGGLIKDASGNVGIGVTPSAWGSRKALEVGNAGSALFSVGANQNYLTSNSYFDGAFKYGATGTATAYQQYAGTHAWLNATSGSAGGVITFTQAMTLDASGNLGVGVTSMSNALEIKRGAGVNAYIEIAGNNNTPGSTSALYGQDSGNVAYCWNRANAPLLFGTNGTERARIDSSGNLIQGGVTTGSGLKGSSLSSSASNNTVNSTSYNITTGGVKIFWVYLGDGNGTLCSTSYTASTISFLGPTPTNIVNSSTPSASQLGIWKNANSHTITFVTGSNASATWASWSFMFLSTTIA